MTSRFTVKSEVDFIALAPVMLGFQPTHSLVMMTMDSFHARIDAPAEPDIDECIDALLAPAKRHKVAQVAFILFDDGDHDRLKAELTRRFTEAGIQLVAALEVGEGKYREFYGQWKPLDLSDHPLVLDALYHGVAPRHRTRDELVEYAKPCGDVWQSGFDEAYALLHQEGIDAAISSLSRETAKQDVDVWTKVLRSCEPGSDEVSDVALVLAFAAWLAGDGALAWVALDQSDRSATMHQLLYVALTQAVNPADWERA